MVFTVHYLGSNGNFLSTLSLHCISRQSIGFFMSFKELVCILRFLSRIDPNESVLRRRIITNYEIEYNAKKARSATMHTAATREEKLISHRDKSVPTASAHGLWELARLQPTFYLYRQTIAG
jgi:hypothetical protein